MLNRAQLAQGAPQFRRLVDHIHLRQRQEGLQGGPASQWLAFGTPQSSVITGVEASSRTLRWVAKLIPVEIASPAACRD
jgi:hypothetical protein